jgi:hypothetical protein
VTQPLEANGFSLLSVNSDKAGGMSLVQLQFDVTHSETRHQWKQGVLLSDEQLAQLHELLGFTISERNK